MTIASLLSEITRVWRSRRSRAENTRAPSRRRRLNIERLEDRITPTVTWDGGGQDNSWENPLNWSTDLVPGPGDDVAISATQFVISTSPLVSVNSINSLAAVTFEGALSLAASSAFSGATIFNGPVTLGGDLNLAMGSSFAQDVYIPAGAQVWLSVGTYNVAAGIDFQGGGQVRANGVTVNLQGDASFDTLLLEGGQMNGSGLAVVRNNLTWGMGPGVMSGGGTLRLETGSTFNITGFSDKTLDWHVDSYGATTWQAGNVTSNGMTFTNRPGATFTLQQSAGTWSSVDGLFDNQGTLTSQAWNGTFAAPFDSSNIVNVLTGALTFTQGGQFGNTANIQAGATLNLGAGGFTLNSVNLIGDGAVVQTGVNTTILGQVNAANLTYELRGGSLGGPGTFVVKRTLLWTGGVMSDGGSTIVDTSGTMSITANVRSEQRTMLNRGLTTIAPSRTLTLMSNTFTNEGTFVLNGDAVLHRDGPPMPTFINHNRVQKAGPGRARIRPDFMNNGIVQVAEGELELVGTGNYSGTFDLLSGTMLTLTNANAALPSIHAFQATSAVNGSGEVVFGGTAATLTLAANFSLIMAKFTITEGGLIQGNGGSVIRAVEFYWNIGTIGDAELLAASGDTLTIGEEADVNLQDGVVTVRGAAHWAAASDIAMSGLSAIVIDGGRFTITNGQSVVSQGGLGQSIEITNGGIIEKLAGGQTTFAAALSNEAGVLLLNGHSLQVTANYTISNGTTDLGSSAGVLDVHNLYQDGNLSTTEIRGGGLVVDNVFLSGGVMNLAGGGISAGISGVVDISGGVFDGPGIIAANVINASQISISGYSVTGNLSITGNYTQAASGDLVVSLSGAGSYGTLSVSGSVTLAGSFTVWLFEYSPQPGDAFDVLLFTGSRNGTFNNLNGPGNLDYSVNGKVTLRT